ncbi:sensor histidine kinase [Spirosoma sp. RP8]|uniref:Sensor histidine kinase n=1 Tax=Spirosoma liriopis TaxID=2937440 RepID=A0ABT0HUH6_9BACT|nr:sensor histidine kinase [Spirosoma liriopis]MCK8495278.1 sensor histidine kinase [Spirosoma liriopis]
MHTWILKGAPWQAYLAVMLFDLPTIIVSYYLFASVGLPKLYSGKRLWVVFCLGLIYTLNTLANYVLYNWIANTYHILTTVPKAFGNDGFLHALFGRNTLLINWSFTLSTLAIPVAGKIVKDMLMVRTKAAELERDNLKLELQFLQAQIQPHFILNSLNSVYSMVAGTNDEAGSVVLRLSHMLRYALYETANPTISLAREVEFLQEYIGLEAVRQHERTTLSFHHDGPLEPFLIPPMLLVTFVENAFKHGINSTYRQAWADIKLQTTDEGKLRFRVENSKPSDTIRHNAPKRPIGVGIINTRRRLNLLFPNRYTLIIHDEVDTFTIDLILQLEPKATIENSSVASSTSTL